MQAQIEGQHWMSRVWNSTKRWFEEDRIWLNPTPRDHFTLRDTKHLEDDHDDENCARIQQDDEVALPFDPSDPNTW